MQYSIVKHGRRLPLSTPALDAHSTLFSSKLCAVSPAATELSPSPLSSRPPRASPADKALLPEGLALGLFPSTNTLKFGTILSLNRCLVGEVQFSDGAHARAEKHTQRGSPWPLSASLHAAFSVPSGDGVPGYPQCVGAQQDAEQAHGGGVSGIRD